MHDTMEQDNDGVVQSATESAGGSMNCSSTLAGSSSCCSITKEDVIGGPVTSVSIQQSPSCTEIWYSRGPFLYYQNSADAISESTGSDGTGGGDKVLVFRSSESIRPAGCSIHGIRHMQKTNDSRMLVVFGGRYISFVQSLSPVSHTATTSADILSVCDVLNRSSNDNDLRNASKPTTVLQLEDWIWDICTVNNSNPTSFQLIVGLAHNSVEIWNITTGSLTMFAQKQLTYQGSTKCITYSMSILAQQVSNNHHHRIAVGTVMNTIHLWDIPSSTNAADEETLIRHVTEETILKGHQGVIHDLYFSTTATLLSTSDDRSVRVWKEISNGSWVLQWTGWGHTARGWSVMGTSISAPSTSNDVVTKEYVLSTGEDGTLRVWDAPTSSSYVETTTRDSTILRGHSSSSSCVRSVDCCQNSNDTWVITGADDGTVALYNLTDRIVRTSVTTVVVPDDRCAPSTTQSQQAPSIASEGATVSTDATETSSSPIKKKKKRKKIAKQTIIGMEFMDVVDSELDINDSDNVEHTNLLIGTRDGSLFVLDTCTYRWIEQMPWWRRSIEATTTGGCCMSVCPYRQCDDIVVVAIGVHSGDIILATVQKMAHDDNITTAQICTLSDGRLYKCVQKMQWINNNTLVSFHVESVVVWRIAIEPTASIPSVTQLSRTALMPSVDSKRIGMCIDTISDGTTTTAAVGDTRGFVAIYRIDNSSSGSNIVSESVVCRLHGREHVTAVSWLSPILLLSVGNDGCIVKSKFDGHDLCKLLSIPVGSYTGLSYMLDFASEGYSDECTGNKKKDNNSLVGGYYSNTFAISNLWTGYEAFSVDTGGRQRPLSLHKCRNGRMLVAVKSEKNGLNAIDFHCGYARSNSVDPSTSSISDVMLSSYGVPMHGESIFDMQFMQIGATMALLTGSEDCTARFCSFRNGEIVHSQKLPRQVNGVRAVSSCAVSTECTVLVIGARRGVEVFTASQPLSSTTTTTEHNSEIEIMYVAQGLHPIQTMIDHRLNAIDTTLDISSGTIIVACGDTNGSCYVYRFPSTFQSTHRQVRETGKLFAQADRPILSVQFLRAESSLFLLTGTTKGDVHIYLYNELFDDDSKNAICVPLLSYTAHSVGTNSISARLIDDRQIIRVCTAGDDQGLCMVDIRFSSNGTPLLQIENTVQLKNAALSAIKGVAFIDDNHVVASGYDQRVSVYLFSGTVLKVIHSEIASVGDVNCVSAMLEHDKMIVAVGGAGLELFTISI